MLYSWLLKYTNDWIASLAVVLVYSTALFIILLLANPDAVGFRYME